MIGKKILVNNYPMTIVGVSAAGFAGIDPAQGPQIRVPVQTKLVMREVMVLMSIGFGVGIPAALALGRYVSAQLYGIPPHDPWMAGATVILLTVVSAVAGLIPAQRASRIDPILALRYE